MASSARTTAAFVASGDLTVLAGCGHRSQLPCDNLVVELFDAKTGVRFTDARIRADVSARSYNHTAVKPVELMQIAGTTTYGNFFLMRGQDV
jgi:hypothetical protein